MSERNNLFGINKEVYSFPSLENKKVLFIGIGGGSDVVSAFGVASYLRDANPSADITYGVSISPKKDYSGFEKISQWLFKRKDGAKNEGNLHHTLSLVVDMQTFDDNFQPLLFVRPKYADTMDVLKHQEEVSMAFKDTLDIIKPDVIFAIDGGGDSLTGGVSDNVAKEFDRTGIVALQEYGKPFTYIVNGPGCDGESTMEMLKNAVKNEDKNGSFLGSIDISPFIKRWENLSLVLLKNNRTPNIMRIAYNEIKENPNMANGILKILRHREPEIPRKWLVLGLVFNGLLFSKK